MRVNVYEEEMTDEVQVVETVASGTGITYYGVRIIMKSAGELHNTEEDDDRSAITFWFGNQDMCELFCGMCKTMLAFS